MAMMIKASKALTIKDLQGKKPHFSGGNTKLGNMLSWSTLKGGDDERHYIPRLKGSCSGTCGKYCTECTKLCYVNKSYRIRPSVLYGHAINTVWLKEDVDQTFKYLEQQLKRKRKPVNAVRINQSGELSGYKELARWVRLATLYPKTQFYVYTKNYDAVKELCQGSDAANIVVPENMTVLMSIWHDCGVKEWNKLKKYAFLKAFVYDDGEDLKVKPTTYCKAYDDRGRMNHNVTCDICKKCFNRNSDHKVIGCKSH